MARLKSRIPQAPDVPQDMFRYLEGLDRRIPARTDLSPSALLTEVITAYNTLLADLRENGLMERS